MMAGSSFYDAGPLKQIAINLFYGWGYNFYRTENQLRADDLMIRGKVAWILGTARQSVANAEADYRREFIPAPSRAHPYPPADAVKTAQALERFAKEIGALEALIHAQPAPENDFILRRLRDEAPTLGALLDHDCQLIGQAELLRTMLEGHDGVWIAENLARLREGVQAITDTLRARQGVLMIPA
jgi:hypothetical protein